jgi:hypothetical protein
MKKMIKEEQYTTSINVGTFRTRQEAEAQLDYLRKKYGFSEENSYVNGTTVTVEIEKSVTDDSYYYEMVDALKREKQNIMNRYKMVSENMGKSVIKINENELRKIVSEAIQRNLVKEGEEFIGDELQTIKNAVDSIKQKITGGNMPGSGYDPTSDYFLSSKIEELEGIVNELLSDTWH